MSAQVNRDRAVMIFRALCRIPSPRQHVEQITEFLKQFVCVGFGLSDAINGPGNLIVGVPATQGCESLPTLGFEAHMDTVDVNGDIIPIDEGGLVRSNGMTILGADDKSGIAAIIEMLVVLKESSIAHGPLEILFTVGEESAPGRPTMYGVREMNYAALKSQRIICVDGDRPDVLIRGCAAKLKWRTTFTGTLGHPMEPGTTVNANLVAAAALMDANRQRLFGDQTKGLIEGRTTEETVWHHVSEIVSDPLADARKSDWGLKFPATNEFPRNVVVCGELRAFKPVLLKETFDHLKESFEQTARIWEAQVHFSCETPYLPFTRDISDPIVRDTLAAMQRAGIENPTTQIMAGATHANVFNERGIPSIVVGVGAHDPHMNSEHLIVDEFLLGIQVLVELARAGR